MEELTDSTPLLGDQDQLMERMAREGYLLLRSVLPAAEIRAAHDTVESAFLEGGWIDEKGNAQQERAATQYQEREPAYRKAAQAASFNRIPYLEALHTLMQGLLGQDVFCHPSKVLRATPPAAWTTESGRYVHQDFSYWGVNDMLTTWIPLMDIPVELGGLALLPGSQVGPPRPLRVLTEDEPGWATTDYRLGDVVIFHCFTAHAATPNKTNGLRRSADFRWQRTDEPVRREFVLGQGDRTQELFSGRFQNEAWWRPVPTTVPLVEGMWDQIIRPGASRFFPVHDSWNSWDGAREEQA
ncbi:phytanoyl-CoA dioxygenase family protein [Streptomyces sp. NPDC051214]|uniref:phytanoyl-CoA dioxygenase family protein n=1 Tax=Streptomyces sp. NPDC051214 TaxID=3155282 RepID=UPI0034339E63